jgi:outer membrane protein assembly factor BamB
MPTAGGLVFFGDTGGNFYALDPATGQKLWGRKIGGVITYTAGGAQKVAVATGLANVYWPTDVVTGKDRRAGPWTVVFLAAILFGTKKQLTKLRFSGGY